MTFKERIVGWGVLLLASFPLFGSDIGTVIFSNGTGSRVFDSRTGLPVEPGIAVAGLYYSTDLEAAPDPSAPLDSFKLAAVTPVSPSPLEVLWGYFNGGIVEIPDSVRGQPVHFQVRIWLAGYESYEEAWHHQAGVMAHSDLLGPVSLGGGVRPPPALSHFLLSEMTLRWLTGNNIPVAQDASFTIREDQTLQGNLQGNDYDGDPLTFSLLTAPGLGVVTIHPDGTFTYAPSPGMVGVDSFQFTVSDGDLVSRPATVAINILPQASVGRIIFKNDARNQIVDSRTGSPIESGTVIAGLYVSTDLNSVPDPQVPNDDFDLIATVPVDGEGGLFDGGILEIPGTLEGQDVLLQVRIWNVPHQSYEEAFLDPEALVGVSALIGPITLGGVTLPIPVLANAITYTPITLLLINANQPPITLDTTFPVPEDTTLSGQLQGSDPDGDSINFHLNSDPFLGIVTLNPDGQFIYQPAINTHGTDTFTFYATDAELESTATTVTIQITPVNDPPTAAIQIAPLTSLFGPTTIPIVLAPNNTRATVVLDGSASSDTENDPLVYAWYLNQQTTPLTYGETVVAELETGITTITLAVDDGTDIGTTSIDVEVVTPSDAVQELNEQIVNSNLKSNRKKPLISSLNAAQASFDRDKFKTGRNQLGAFQNIVRAQVRKWAPALADRLMADSTEIIEAVQ